jgi:uncharacterized membrane protein
VKTTLRYVLGVSFVLAGANHFLNPELYLQIMPSYLPWHLFLVYLSGIFEIVFGALVFIPKFTRVAAWGLVLLLITIFPANLHMALNAKNYANIPSVLLWLRLPLQAVLIAWAYGYTRPVIQEHSKVRSDASI